VRGGGVGGSLAAALRGARQRVTEAGWSVVLTPVAAGLAWYIAHTLLGHHQPFFAPTAAAVSPSKNRVLRGQRALQLMVGPVPGGSGAAQPPGPHAQLIARLAETCADDTLRLVARRVTLAS
jgi:hypothetical protein